MQIEMVEEHGVARLEDRSLDSTGLAGALLRQLMLDHNRVEGGASIARADDVVEPPRYQVHAGGEVAAARKREPEIERVDVSQELAVLVPCARHAGVGAAQSRLVG